MSMFLKTLEVGQSFMNWPQSPGGGWKLHAQADQIVRKALKHLKFCCSDITSLWEIRKIVVHYCVGSLKMLSDFVEYLQKEWNLAYFGIIGYTNATAHILDFKGSI